MKHMFVSSYLVAKASTLVLLLAAFAATAKSSLAAPQSPVTAIFPAKPIPPAQYTQVTKGDITIGADATVTTDSYDYLVETRYIIYPWSATHTLGDPKYYYFGDQEVPAHTNATPIIRRTTATITTLGQYHGIFVIVPKKDTHDGFYEPFPGGDDTDFEVVLKLQDDTGGIDFPGGPIGGP